VNVIPENPDKLTGNILQQFNFDLFNQALGLVTWSKNT